MEMLIPIPIDNAMLGAGTNVDEPASSETAWVSAAAYALGDRRIRSTTHLVYECVLAHSGRPELPENDPIYWKSDGPTVRTAPFDTYASTPAVLAGNMTYVISPGYFNAISVYGLSGVTLILTVKDAPGGAVIYSETVQLEVTEPNWYEYFFSRPRVLDRYLFKDIPPRPAAEINLQIQGANTAVGMIVVGDLRKLANDAQKFGGTEAGVSVEPVTYSYINADEFGTTTIVRRHKATGMRARVKLALEDADAALLLIQEHLDIPVAWIAVNRSGFSGLNVFGIGSASHSYYESHASIDLTVKGLI